MNLDKDYLLYAFRQLQIAIDKRDDAPASSAQHERQALLALAKCRIPTVKESLDSWSLVISEEDNSVTKTD